MQLFYITLFSLLLWNPFIQAEETLSLPAAFNNLTDSLKGLYDELKPLPPHAASEAYAKELFAQVDAERKNNIFTQSNAHLSIPRIQEKVAQSDLLTHKAVQQEAFALEKELGDKYYVFYSAIPSQYHVLQDVSVRSYLRLLTDVTKKLHERITGEELKDFHFLRYTYNDPTYNQYENVTDFMVQEINKKGLIDDNESSLKPILLSVNLAYFGNAGLSGESTQYYFDHPQPWASAPEGFLKSCLQSYGYDPIWTAELLEAAKLIEIPYAELFQIFIPTTLVDTIAYLSWREGMPFDIPLIKKMFNRPSMTFGRGDKLYHEEILEKYADFTKKLQAGEKEAIDLKAKLLANIAKGDYTFYKNWFMTDYKKTPAKYPYLNYYEGRILITNKYMLNPLSGIKIYRYSSITPEQKKVYKEKLNQIFDKMDASKKAPQAP